MSISKYNNEGYPDPTAFGTLSSIENETRALRAFRPMGEVTALYDNPVKQAEYLYSLIESESK